VGINYVARYLKVKEFLLKQITAGKLQPGARMPSEPELVRQFKLSRMTVNRALRELTAEGMVTRIAGRGTFVAEARVHSHPLEVHDIADEIRARNHVHTAQVIVVESIKATAELAERCAIAVGAPLDHSLIVHHESGVPLQVEDRYVLPNLVRHYRQTDFNNITAHEFLMRAAPLQRAEHVVRAILPDKRIRALLQVRASEPCLLVQRKTWSKNRLVSIADLYYPGSRYELSANFRG
jgi:GntR family transcriptional regulator, histidine utilization repressor